MTRSRKNAAPKLVLSPDPKMADLDFDPGRRLARALRVRDVCEGISIDDVRTNLIDDGFWIKRNRDEGGWMIRTSIADVPAIIPSASNFAKAVKERFQDPHLVRQQEFNKAQHIRVFPADFLGQVQSLNQGEIRPAVTFTMNFDYDFKLQSYDIKRNAFKNLRQCHYGPLGAQYAAIKDQVKGWYKIACEIQDERRHDMAMTCDAILGYDDVRAPRQRGVAAFNRNSENESLVQELMRLTNTVAADFFAKNGLVVPVKAQEKRIVVEYVSPNNAFERECDDLAWEIIQKYSINKPAKVRMTSPMRFYSDYLAMKVMTRALDGFPPSDVLARESSRLTGIFNCVSRDDFQFSQLENMRQKTHSAQERQHPFDFLTDHHKGDIVSVQLNGLIRPDVSIRKLHIQGGYVYLVGMMLQKSNQKAWAISRDYESAREMASSRMLNRVRASAPTLA